MFQEADAANVDGFHLVGKIYLDKLSSKKCKSIIVKFTTFHHHKVVYQLKEKYER